MGLVIGLEEDALAGIDEKRFAIERDGHAAPPAERLEQPAEPRAGALAPGGVATAEAIGNRRGGAMHEAGGPPAPVRRHRWSEGSKASATPLMQ